MKPTFEYPLRWLSSQPRTKIRNRSRFGNHSPSKAGDYLIAELSRLGAKYCVISSNLQKRQRGDGFYANQNVDDPGIVVYFQLKGKPKAMACDRWSRAEDNLWALYLSVQAIRGLERWGGSGFLDGLFNGFQALPSPDMIMADANFNVIQPKYYFENCNTQKEIRKRYIELSKELHPDKGGNSSDFAEMQKQYDQRKE